VRAFEDMTLSPVKIENVVYEINSLIKGRKNGFSHYSGNCDISYYDFVK